MTDADRALKFVGESHRTVVTPDLGSTPELWGHYIEEYQRAGWRLEQWAVTSDGRGYSHAFPVFTRAEALER